jgi:diacylglycerol kinase family enzyme
MRRAKPDSILVSTITKPPETGLAPPEAARRFPGTKPRMLLIVNPWATSVSARLKNLVVYALRGRYDIEAVETQARDHATALTREAVGEGFDLVVAFGGDGTLNEVVNGLAGSDTPVSVLPGGCTNVVCRMLGIPTDVVDATEHLLQLSDDLRPRRIDLGRVNGRYFVFSSGVGIDAEATDWVDSRPWLKSRSGDLAFTIAAVQSFLRNYRAKPPSMAVEIGGERVEGISAMVQNSDPYTYFGSRPLRLCEDISIDNGFLSVLMMRRATTLDAPGVLRHLFARNGRLANHRRAESFTHVQHARVVSLDGRPLPMEVDGDYIGTAEEFVYEAAPGALTVVA